MNLEHVVDVEEEDLVRRMPRPCVTRLPTLRARPVPSRSCRRSDRVPRACVRGASPARRRAARDPAVSTTEPGWTWQWSAERASIGCLPRRAGQTRRVGPRGPAGVQATFQGRRRDRPGARPLGGGSAASVRSNDVAELARAPRRRGGTPAGASCTWSPSRRRRAASESGGRPCRLVR